MKILGKFFLWFFVFLLGTNLILAAIMYRHDAYLGSLSSIISPLPRMLTQVFSQKALASAFWQPNLQQFTSSEKKPELTAKAAISYDTATDTLLYSKYGDEKLPIASLTKIMTATIALENMDLSDQITVSKSAATIGEDSMGLTEGEVLTLEELLYGLLLNSGNDAAEAIAQGSKFGRADFLHLMNKKAEDLGLTNTRFSNPSGLQGDGTQYSTVKDLLVLTRYALQKESFARIAATYEHHIQSNAKHKEFTLYNETNLLTTYPGVKGVKTGFTDEAGMCLVSYLDYRGHKIIAILLNSSNRRQEMMELLDYSLKSLGVTPPSHG